MKKWGLDVNSRCKPMVIGSGYAPPVIVHSNCCISIQS